MSPSRHLTTAALALALALALLGCGGAPAPAAPGPPSMLGVAGDIRTDADAWVQYTIGNAPLIITAPHGGSLKPAALPDRSCPACLTDTDTNTEDLARRVASLFFARTGTRVHLVINLLQRVKLDPNREVVEATDGHAAAVPAWMAYHTFIDSARGRITSSPGRGLLLDLHGHGHAIPRLELGYTISASDLRLGDAALAASGAVSRSSIARLAVDDIARSAPVALLRGPASLGALFVANGFPAVPSPTDPAPAAPDLYFDGGYTTARHGSSTGSSVDAVQIEAFRVGARDTNENLDRYAAAIVTVALEYLRLHYGWTPARAAASARVTGAAFAAAGP
ncbi:MAG: hypothetical protein ACYC3L_07300 [Gemmatimonadaceae bacterium]